MKRLLFLLIPAIFCLSLISFAKEEEQPVRVLVFSKTLGYRHRSIKDGVKAIKLLGQKNGFSVDHTESSSAISADNLKKYKAIIFLSPTGEFLNKKQKEAFKEFIHNGGGFVGIHAATDCLHKWDWYGEMVGAYFSSHPDIQEAQLNVIDKKHLSTQGLLSPWKHRDEWYNFTYTNKNIKVLLTLDETSYKGGKNGDKHPIAWYHNFEGGKVFYTGLGHTKESYTDATFLKHLQGGILDVLSKDN
jgi:type 1 glutamine amidotransferase